MKPLLSAPLALLAFHALTLVSCATTREEPKRERVPPRDEPPLVIIIEPAEPKPSRETPPRETPPRETPPTSPTSPTSPAEEEAPPTVLPDGVLPSLGRGEVPDRVPPEPPGLDRQRTMTVHVLDIG